QAVSRDLNVLELDFLKASRTFHVAKNRRRLYLLAGLLLLLVLQWLAILWLWSSRALERSGRGRVGLNLNVDSQPQFGGRLPRSADHFRRSIDQRGGVRDL